MSTSPHESSCPFCKGLHWHKYLYLENKLIDISKYVTVDKKNFTAWGEELADLLVLIGNEMDTFFRDMFDCPYFQTDPNFLSIRKRKAKWTMREYRKVYEIYYELSENSLDFQLGLGGAYNISPFSKLSARRPSWWTAYNKIKHEHYDHLRKANLKNVVNCLGGLLILNALHLCSKHRLAINRLIKYQDPIRQSALDIIIDEPARISNEILKSKIGTTIWEPSSFIETEIFRFDYRTDEDIGVSDSPIITCCDYES